MHFLCVFACRGKKKKTSPASLMDFKGGPVINGQTISAGVLQRVYILYNIILYALYESAYADAQNDDRVCVYLESLQRDNNAALVRTIIIRAHACSRRKRRLARAYITRYYFDNIINILQKLLYCIRIPQTSENGEKKKERESRETIAIHIHAHCPVIEHRATILYYCLSAAAHFGDLYTRLVGAACVCAVIYCNDIIS